MSTVTIDSINGTNWTGTAINVVKGPIVVLGKDIPSTQVGGGIYRMMMPTAADGVVDLTGPNNERFQVAWTNYDKVGNGQKLHILNSFNPATDFADALINVTETIISPDPVGTPLASAKSYTTTAAKIDLVGPPSIGGRYSAPHHFLATFECPRDTHLFALAVPFEGELALSMQYGILIAEFDIPNTDPDLRHISFSFWMPARATHMKLIAQDGTDLSLRGEWAMRLVEACCGRCGC